MSLALAGLILVCVFTYAFEIVFGLAGTIMMVAIMSLVYEPRTLVVYSLLPQILVATIGLGRSPRVVRARPLAGMLGAAALGMAAGLWIFFRLGDDQFRRLLATAITLFGAYLVLVPAPPPLPPWARRLLDGLAGASQALFGISGPVAMTRLLATYRDKTEVRNYALAFFLAMNLMRAAGYLAEGTVTPEIAGMMAWSAPFLAVSLWYANHLHFRVREGVFRRVVAWIILLGGLSLYRQ